MSGPIIDTFALGTPWETIDPFLFCVHHHDAYPVGDGSLGPAASLDGRQIGMDFAGIDGWRMYHGDHVPGFPQHPHRGFETITFVREGFVDHSDSMGAIARYGAGDTQWLTAGAGIVHAEMFPLLHADRDNPLELFQIWLNLPPATKMADPHFTMIWDENTPRIHHVDDDGRATTITVVAGALEAAEPPAPPPDSWASVADSDVAVWHVSLDAGATWTLPAAAGATTRRSLYAFEGAGIGVGDDTLATGFGSRIRCGSPVTLSAPNGAASCLVLQGRPIDQPVASYGPFVMNTEAELAQAFADYRSTGFGGWPWPDDAPTNGFDAERFALHPDGRRLVPPRS